MNNYPTTSFYSEQDAISAFVKEARTFGRFLILSCIVIAVSMWKIFVKAGKKGWTSLIPYYNIVVMLEIVKLPAWYLLLMFVPIVNVIIGVMVMAKMAKAFGKGTGFVLGMLFLPFIFYPILAFDKSEYIIEG